MAVGTWRTMSSPPLLRKECVFKLTHIRSHYVRKYTDTMEILSATCPPLRAAHHYVENVHGAQMCLCAVTMGKQPANGPHTFIGANFEAKGALLSVVSCVCAPFCTHQIVRFRDGGPESLLNDLHPPAVTPAVFEIRIGLRKYV